MNYYEKNFNYLHFRLLDLFISILMIIFFIPLWIIIFLLLKLFSPGPFIFVQKRLGKNKKEFNIYKIRTMIKGAHKLQPKLIKLNEANGPVFKIHDDPRYNFFGKFLSQLGLDESLQVLNVIKGEMSIVGPRPLPTEEAKLIPKKYSERSSVLPGMTSLWVIRGGHKLTFKQWMDLDVKYIKERSVRLYLFIIMMTFFILVKKILFRK